MARRAGMNAASIATAASTVPTPTNVNGSVGSISNRSPERKRDNRTEATPCLQLIIVFHRVTQIRFISTREAMDSYRW